MYKFDVCYLNQQKQIVLVTVNANDRNEAYRDISNNPDCRKYHHVPSITSITQRANAPM